MFFQKDIETMPRKELEDLQLQRLKALVKYCYDNNITRKYTIDISQLGLVNGDVVPCCLDGEGCIVLGNIFKENLDIEKIVIEKAKFIYETKEKFESNINSKLEVKNKYGETSSYKEYEVKTKDYSGDKWNNLNNEMNNIIRMFSECKKQGSDFNSDQALILVKNLQDFITQNYYDCTNEILYGLGKMYVSDERFKNNIDKNGNGTADFASKAIEIYSN